MYYITTEIQGGLGNQLFQIANLFLYNNKINNKKEIIFKYEEKLDNFFKLERKTFWNSLFLNKFIFFKNNEYDKYNFQLIYEKESHKSIINNIIDINENIKFIGYFQSFKYYDDNLRNQMIDLIYNNKTIIDIANEHYNNIKNKFNVNDDEMITIHVRRTDYIYSNDFHHPLELNYYKNALEIANNKKVVIFSDDIEWCKKVFDKNMYSVDINNVEIEFILMSLFKNNIIANSTFSLWASYISKHENKLIIAPKQWYANQVTLDYNEIYHKYITHII